MYMFIYIHTYVYMYHSHLPPPPPSSSSSSSCGPPPSPISPPGLQSRYLAKKVGFAMIGMERHTQSLPGLPFATYTSHSTGEERRG